MTVYSDEVVATMVRRYGEAVNTDEARAAVVTELALELGVPEPSIRAKLSAEQVYVRKTYTPKNGGPIVSKNSLADKIADIANEEYDVIMAEGEIESLTKANKTVLLKLIKILSL